MTEPVTTDKFKYLKVLGFSVLGSVSMTYFTCGSCRVDAGSYLWVTFFSVLVWFFLWAGNDILTHFINEKISWVKFPVKRLIVGIITTAVYTVTVVLVIDKTWKWLSPFSVGNNTWIVVFALIITFLISLFLHGREFLIRWKKSAVEAERLEKESVRAQYESLRNQVNPHFLFNSLNALTHLVYEDQDKAAQFIKQLSEVYRYVLDTRDREVVPIEEELKFIDSYLFLQKIRFGDKLKVDINLTSPKSAVAPLALQMLIENAIKHNVISEEDPLVLKVYADESFFIVENRIHKKTTLQEGSSGLGLENIRRRYEFLGNEKMIVSDSAGKFIVKLPIIPIPL
jgi:sensor histidine kinase YesM